MTDTRQTEFDALLNRAHRYYHEIYAETGIPPDCLLVTEREYMTLLRAPRNEMSIQRWYTPDLELGLFGMRVKKPEPRVWTITDIERVLESVSGPPRRLDAAPSGIPRRVDSETSSLEEWEAAVHTMIADAKQRRVAGGGYVYQRSDARVEPIGIRGVPGDQ